MHIRAIHERSRCRYGSPRITQPLKNSGHRVSKKRVERLMRKNKFRARRKKRFGITTKSKEGQVCAPNLLCRDFTAPGPDRVWVGDITYLWTRKGWVYLAVLLDVFSRRVVDWAMRPYLAREVAIEAVRRAVQLRRPRPGLIAHTDRGSQYASGDYRNALKAAGMQQSMSRSGDCWDNAMAENFFATLEHELLRQNDFVTRTEALWSVADFIQNFYNHEPIHSALDYDSPISYEESCQGLKSA